MTTVPKRKAAAVPVHVADGAEETTVTITPLGAGQEVGRSCIIMSYLGKNIMFDCGIHPGYSGMASLPYLDDVDLSTVDVMLVTHFHLDHCCAVPYVVGHTNFRGRIFMTHPTKAIYHTLLQDFVDLSRGSSDEAVLFSKEDLEASMDRIEVINFRQTLDLGNGITITPYAAGHVLGACMFMVSIEGMNCLYTGDYSRKADRHLPGADTPVESPHIVIVESTYGVASHSAREEREQRFVQMVRSVVERGGRVLLPVVALGRAQELLLILHDYWEAHPEIHNVPIYQASGLARRALSVYQTYIEMMNDDIKVAFEAEHRNPFLFERIKHLSSSHFDDVGACVVMATPSMMQSGVSRELFEAWCDDKRNGVIIADFAVQGTLAREVLGEPSEIMCKSGLKKPLKMSVEAISFSAHADYPQTSSFLDELNPPHVVLVHGEATEMGRLKRALEQAATAQNMDRTVHTPRNTQGVQIPCQARRVAKVVGQIAAKAPEAGKPLRGVMVQRGEELSILHPDDLVSYTKIRTGKVIQRQALELSQPFSAVRLALEAMFEGVDALHVACASPTASNRDVEEQPITVGDSLTITPVLGKGGSNPHVIIEWQGGAPGDIVADAVMAVLLKMSREPMGLEAASSLHATAMAKGDEDAVTQAEIKMLGLMMQAQFGNVEVDEDLGLLRIDLDGQLVTVDHMTDTVTCDNDVLRQRVDKARVRMLQAMRPCSYELD
eukprot:CAMPEP_0117682844 /NCGR_PEP_ID=MMETSP0804-20121206/19958_1 /TAXON_ID=1074897 /ORGANISM="Tetraselmis astigmatica, Strain CCMP880" /LENGTH=721 /DNA_ID=CAMNT_0005493147 /DNA_START=103 /DNA_END=2265 /DNA_ORIENTATION=-